MNLIQWKKKTKKSKSEHYERIWINSMYSDSKALPNGMYNDVEPINFNKGVCVRVYVSPLFCIGV